MYPFHSEEMTVQKAGQERFWARVDRSAGADGCWVWLGRATARGYGQFMVDGSREYAHRLSFAWATGNPAPVGAHVDHKCHNKLCVNPRHLHAVSVSENAQNRKGPQVNSRSGVRGVYAQDGRWRVQIRANGRNVSGGMYDEAAAVALRNRLMDNNLTDRSLR